MKTFVKILCITGGALALGSAISSYYSAGQCITGSPEWQGHAFRALWSIAFTVLFEAAYPHENR